MQGAAPYFVSRQRATQNCACIKVHLSPSGEGKVGGSPPIDTLPAHFAFSAFIKGHLGPLQDLLERRK